MEEKAVSLIGRTLYELLIKGYTEKQWGKKATELSPELINRLPVRDTFDNRYFNDRYQGIPEEGYSRMIEKMLDGIEVRTGVNQPSVEISLHRYPDWSRRVTYRDRRYVLDGFACQEDFYHPDYRRNPPAEGQKDYRRTLYWNPDLQLDAEGKAHVTLFNNSQTTVVSVEAEGQTKDGTLLYTK